jgi:hypothetical protein
VLLLTAVVAVLLQLPGGVKDLDGAALLQHAGKVQSAVMMALNEHNTVAHAVSAQLLQAGDWLALLTYQARCIAPTCFICSHLHAYRMHQLFLPSIM